MYRGPSRGPYIGSIYPTLLEFGGIQVIILSYFPSLTWYQPSSWPPPPPPWPAGRRRRRTSPSLPSPPSLLPPLLQDLAGLRPPSPGRRAASRPPPRRPAAPPPWARPPGARVLPPLPRPGAALLPAWCSRGLPSFLRSARHGRGLRGPPPPRPGRPPPLPCPIRQPPPLLLLAGWLRCPTPPR